MLPNTEYQVSQVRHLTGMDLIGRHLVGLGRCTYATYCAKSVDENSELT